MRLYVRAAWSVQASCTMVSISECVSVWLWAM